MDGENSHTVGIFTLDGLATDTLIPCREKRIYVGGILIHITSQLIIEGKHVGTLVIQNFQTEDGMQSFRQIVERHC